MLLLPLEVVIIIFQYYCENIFKEIKDGHSYIQPEEHPKRIINELRMLSRVIKFYAEEKLTKLFFEFIGIEKTESIEMLSLKLLKSMKNQVDFYKDCENNNLDLYLSFNYEVIKF